MKKIIFIYLLFVLQGLVYPQLQDTSAVNRRSSNIPTILPDSTAVTDTAAVSDTLRKQSDINAIIYASGSDSLIFRIPDRKMEIYGRSELKYKQTDLKSANIYVDFQTNRIKAEGVVDTSDTSRGGLTGTPVLSEAGEIYEGQSITYDFKTQRGFISLAKNASEGAIYGGSKVKKVDKNVYFIQNGTYTTCEDDPTDFYFYAKEMKVILKEQIIAKWIWLYIAGVPLPLPLPIGVFPNQTGRRSGIIPPAYGQREGYGHYFSHLGYFWAISDFMDVNLTTDLYTQGSFTLNSAFRYVKRYSLSGHVIASYGNMKYGTINDPGYNQSKTWRLSAVHHQQLNPSTNLDANLSFQSGNYFTTTSSRYSDVLQQDIISSATLFKTWEEAGNSLSLNYQRNQNLQTGNIQEELPNLSFNMSQKYPFKRKGKVDPADQKWYEFIGYNYSGQFLNRRNKESGNLKTRGGIQHSISSSVSPKVGYFNITPSISYQERWYNKRIEQFSVPLYRADSAGNPVYYRDSVVTRDVKDLSAVRTFHFSLAASTKLYGMLQPRALGIDAFRHTITPSVSYEFQPDFSKPGFGYFSSYTNSRGEVIRYNKYQNEVFGGATSGESQSIYFSVGNVFEIKTIKDPTDTTSEQRKIQLLNLNAGLRYNFAAETNRLSDLSLSYNTRIGEYLNLAGNTSYSFYDFDQTAGRRSVRFLSSQGKGLMRLVNFGFNLSTSLSGEKLKGKKPQEQNQNDPGRDTDPYSNNNSQRRLNQAFSDEPPDFSVPWDLSLSFYYNLSKENPADVSKSANMNANLNFSLTQTLKISFSTSYDFVHAELLTPSVRIYKDLHCWEASFNWQPLGAYRGYYFQIKIKAPQLQDIKLERSRGAMSGRYF